MPSYSCPKLELKYCERCGGLWLRPQDSEAIYCARCAEAIADLPPASRQGGPGAMQAAHSCLIALFLGLSAVTGCLGGMLA